MARTYEVPAFITVTREGAAEMTPEEARDAAEAAVEDASPAYPLGNVGYLSTRVTFSVDDSPATEVEDEEVRT